MEITTPFNKEHPLNPLSPREVQQRVRAGEAPEFVAQETGWDVTRVVRYAEPPLRERAYVAQCAREVQLHQSRGSASLEMVVSDSLGRKTDELVWDSAYVKGQWLVQVQVQDGAGTDTANWSYEPAGKSVNPLNPLARTLMGLEPTRGTISPASRESTIIVETNSGRIAPVKLSAVPELFTIEEPEPVEPELVEPELVESVSPAPEESTPAPSKKTRKGRAKVPSWDEILFGATSTED